ncbi:PREDICTED: uncharacterized protein LOC105437992, partial [Paramuricea clavata]
MDCGIGNSRRYINVTNIAEILEEHKPGLASPDIMLLLDVILRQLFIGKHLNYWLFHFWKGKSKPLSIIENDQSGSYVNLFIDMGDRNSDVDLHIASEFVCRIYAVTKTKDVNEARYQKLIQMTGKVDQNDPLANIKRIDCSLLPPSLPALMMKIRRTQYVTAMWTICHQQIMG